MKGVRWHCAGKDRFGFLINITILKQLYGNTIDKINREHQSGSFELDVKIVRRKMRTKQGDKNLNTWLLKWGRRENWCVNAHVFEKINYIVTANF